MSTPPDWVGIAGIAGSVIAAVLLIWRARPVRRPRTRTPRPAAAMPVEEVLRHPDLRAVNEHLDRVARLYLQT